MKKVLFNINSHYKNNIILIIPFSIITILLYFIYRIEIYTLIMSHYPDLNLLSFAEYMNTALFYDSTAILYSQLFLFITIFIFAKTKKIKYILCSTIVISLSLYLLISIDFFKAYETTFQTSFLGKEHATALSTLMQSILSEMSQELIIKFIFFIIFAAILTSLLYMLEKKIDLHKHFKGSSKKHIIALRYFFPALLIILLIIKTGADTKPVYYKTASKLTEIPSKKIISTIHEFSMNPVYNLFDNEKKDINNSFSETESNSQFTFKLNTDSIESSKIFKKQNIIPRGKKYNIIFYFFESTPYKYLKTVINGKYVAETWNRLEKNSIVSYDHYTHYPLSANALLSIFTSAYSMCAKDPAIEMYPDIDLTTISEILKDNGYRTCLLHTGMLKYAGQDRFLKKRKFDKIIEYNDLKKPPYEDWVGWGLHERAMTEPSINFIKQDESKPFFITYMPVNPHHPYAIPEKKYQITGPIDKNLDYRKKNWLRYLNSLHYVDAMLGELIDRLDSEGLLDNTLLFLFSDHGEAFYQHKQNYSHPLFLYEENVQIPLLIYNKKLIKKPVYYNGITRHIDILPTVLDILRIDQIDKQEGISILSNHKQQLALLHTTWKDEYMGIRDGKWKYICRLKDQYEELYNLKVDPDEKNNIANKNNDIANRYRAYIINARKYKVKYYKNILGKENNK